MNRSLRPTSFLGGIRRGWALVGREERRRLQLVAVYGVVISALDAFALVLVFALINLLNAQPATGVSKLVIRWLSVDAHDRYRTALVLFAITAALFVLRSLFSVLGLWMTAGAANAAQAGLVARLLIGHARAPQLMRLERNSAETLRTVLISVDQVVSGLVASSVALLSNLAVATAVGVGLVVSSPLVALAIMGYFAVIAAIWVRGVRGGLRRRGRRVQELQQERYRLVLQALGAAKELQLRGRALFYAETANDRTRAINAASRAATVANGSLRYLLETSLVLGAVLVVAAAGATGGRETVLPAVGLVLAAAFRLLPALNQILFLSNQVHFNSPALDFVENELTTFGAFGELPASSDELDVAPLRLTRELRLDGVTFRYPSREQSAVNEVSFAVHRGESVGILGPTGSGKSTLLDLVLGLLEPEQGRITVDGVPFSKSRERWQRSIGYVPQDVYLVDETIRANVALGWRDEEIDDEAVADAIRLAGLNNVVARLPDELDTVVGERGVRLFGGQRQLVGLARALYTRPSVLVLDEATSSLDQATEQRVVDVLRALRGEVTMLIVTHRTTSVRYCDRILYFQSGRIRAEGTLDELKVRLPELRELVPPATIARIG